MVGFTLQIILAAGAVVSIVYAAWTTACTFSSSDGFNTTTMEVLQRYGSQLTIHDSVDMTLWSIIFMLWCPLYIYQFCTFIWSSSKGRICNFGHIPWNYNALVIVGMLAHVMWLQLVHARGLLGMLVVIFMVYIIFMGAHLHLLYSLYEKSPELEEAGLKKHVLIMRIVINGPDCYLAYMTLYLYVSLDASFITFFEFTPWNSYLILMFILAFSQVMNVLLDLHMNNWLMRYLAGGSITLFIGLVAVMLHQMTSLPLPEMTLLNVILSVQCPVMKVVIQCMHQTQENSLGYKLLTNSESNLQKGIAAERENKTFQN